MKHAVKHIHFVGVGGAGMSGIAEILHNLGYVVSGSDQSDSATSRRLARLGIRVAHRPRRGAYRRRRGGRHVDRGEGRQPGSDRGARGSACRWCRAR